MGLCMPGKIVDQLLTSLRRSIPRIENIKSSSVLIGLGYTAVKLETGHVGVCHTFFEESRDCCQVVGRAGTLAGSPAKRLAELAKSWDASEAVVGIAAINALSQVVLERGLEGYSLREDANFIDHVKVGEDDVVVMVGYFHPFLRVLRDRAKKLFILERNPSFFGEEDVLPDVACEENVPKADVVIMTGGVLVNGAVDRLLELSRNAREVGLVGPTASMIPDPLFKHGVTVMGGIKVSNPERLLQVIAEGGGVPQFKEACKQVLITKKGA